MVRCDRVGSTEHSTSRVSDGKERERGIMTYTRQCEDTFRIGKSFLIVYEGGPHFRGCCVMHRLQWS